MSCGCAFFDHDAWMDILVLSSSPFRDPPANVLYRNNGDDTFTDIMEAGLLSNEPRYGSGCTFLDYESRWAARSPRLELRSLRKCRELGLKGAGEKYKAAFGSLTLNTMASV